MAASVRAAAQVALQPLIRRTHDHLSALAVRRTLSKVLYPEISDNSCHDIQSAP